MRSSRRSCLSTRDRDTGSAVVAGAPWSATSTTGCLLTRCAIELPDPRFRGAPVKRPARRRTSRLHHFFRKRKVREKAPRAPFPDLVLVQLLGLHLGQSLLNGVDS